MPEGVEAAAGGRAPQVRGRGEAAVAGRRGRGASILEPAGAEARPACPGRRRCQVGRSGPVAVRFYPIKAAQ